ncbi:LacI family DNA-binding transcriptional regulator [Thalassospira sp. TSL5-1]|uniref:LacI family DNA-binding transcriptional regulator n=1 Tax=Thalassospira sp. TSL5-1 TaxID=1544451 RepID=UPI00093EB698|nr:LacI family DNA-binding transcriptional regulator [Thalassospira sp. TSL5-1]OKH86350.1 hypothetical protein LF95_23200 [Thalassospira sp. TSL5-1]
MSVSGRTKISDIASRLGVSTATVSRALSGNGYVREQLASRIRATAIEMNYALPSTASGQKVLIVSSQEAMIDFKRSQFTMYVLEGLRERAESRDIRIESYIYQPNQRFEDLYDAAQAPDLIGLLLVSVDDATLEYVRGSGIPAVMVNGDDPEMALSSVTPCNRSAATLATKHLMAQGHRRILFLNRPGRRTIQRRREGWQDAMAEHYNPDYVIDVDDWTAEAASQRVAEVVDSNLPFSAIVAAGDILAVGAVSALQAKGYVVPKDVSVIGIDGLPQGQYMSPALTSVKIPMQTVGALSLDLLIETCRLVNAGIDMPARRIELACELINRESVCPPAKK